MCCNRQCFSLDCCQILDCQICKSISDFFTINRLSAIIKKLDIYFIKIEVLTLVFVSIVHSIEGKPLSKIRPKLHTQILNILTVSTMLQSQMIDDASSLQTALLIITQTVHQLGIPIRFKKPEIAQTISVEIWISSTVQDLSIHSSIQSSCTACVTFLMSNLLKYKLQTAHS